MILFDSAIGERIRKCREALKRNGRKVSQEVFLDEYMENAVNRKKFSGIEGGHLDNFTVPELLKMCEAFGCGAGYILGEYEGITAECQTAADCTGLPVDSVNYLHDLHETRAAIDGLIGNASANNRYDYVAELGALIKNPAFNAFIRSLWAYNRAKAQYDSVINTPDNVFAEEFKLEPWEIRKNRTDTLHAMECRKMECQEAFFALLASK